jgi:hypothetical protein
MTIDGRIASLRKRNFWVMAEIAWQISSGFKD